MALRRCWPALAGAVTRRALLDQGRYPAGRVPRGCSVKNTISVREPFPKVSYSVSSNRSTVVAEHKTQLNWFIAPQEAHTEQSHFVFIRDLRFAIVTASRAAIVLSENLTFGKWAQTGIDAVVTVAFLPS